MKEEKTWALLAFFRNFLTGLTLPESSLACSKRATCTSFPPRIAKPKTHILTFLFQQLVFRAYIFFNLKPSKRKLAVPVNGDKGDLSPGRLQANCMALQRYKEFSCVLHLSFDGDITAYLQRRQLRPGGNSAKQIKRHHLLQSRSIPTSHIAF